MDRFDFDEYDVDPNMDIGVDMSDYWEGEVVIDYDQNTFTIERGGKAEIFDLDRDIDFLNNIKEYDPGSIVDYEVYGQEW